MAKATRRLGEILVDMGQIDPFEVEEALGEQKRSGERLGDILMKMGKIDVFALWQALSIQINEYMGGLDPSDLAVREAMVENVAVERLADQLIDWGLGLQADRIELRSDGPVMNIALYRGDQCEERMELTSKQNLLNWALGARLKRMAGLNIHEHQVRQTGEFAIDDEKCDWVKIETQPTRDDEIIILNLKS